MPAQTPIPQSALRRCLACGRTHSGVEFASTPLLPAALGGELAPALFQTSVFCAECARLMREAVDPAFLKSWFTHPDAARAAQMFLDPEAPAAAPLSFLGNLRDFPLASGQSCDRWSGMAGEQIYHIHSRDDLIWTGAAGGEIEPLKEPPRERAVLVLASPSQFWSRVALLSLAAHFPNAELFCLNPFAPGLTRGLPVAPLSEMPDLAGAAFIADRGRRGRVVHDRVTHDGAPRLLIKLALGLGDALFGENFRDTTHARALRRGFWQQRPRAPATGGAQEAAPLVTGDGRAARGALHWPGAWSLCLGPADGGFGLVVTAPDGRRLDVLIADEARLWTRDDAWRAPRLFIVAPQRGLFSPPLTLDEFMEHRDGASPHPILAALERMTTQPHRFPNKQGFA